MRYFQERVIEDKLEPLTKAEKWWHIVSSNFASILMMNALLLLGFGPAVIAFALFVNLKSYVHLMLGLLFLGLMGPAQVAVTRSLLEMLWGCHNETVKNLLREYHRNVKQGLGLGWLQAVLAAVLLAPIIMIGTESIPLPIWICVWLSGTVQLLYSSYFSIQAAVFPLTFGQLAKNSLFLLLTCGKDGLMAMGLIGGAFVFLTIESGIAVNFLLPIGAFLMVYGAVVIVLWPSVEDKVHRKEGDE